MLSFYTRHRPAYVSWRNCEVPRGYSATYSSAYTANTDASTNYFAANSGAADGVTHASAADAGDAVTHTSAANASHTATRARRQATQ